MTLTDNQRAVLTTLGGYVEPPTIRQLADKLEAPKAYSRMWGYDRVRSIMVRLEARELVVRDGRHPAHWTISTAGREALA